MRLFIAIYGNLIILSQAGFFASCRGPGPFDVQELGGMTVNQHLQIGPLKGFAAAGANIQLLL